MRGIGVPVFCLRGESRTARDWCACHFALYAAMRKKTPPTTMPRPMVRVYTISYEEPALVPSRPSWLAVDVKVDVGCVQMEFVGAYRVFFGIGERCWLARDRRGRVFEQNSTHVVMPPLSKEHQERDRQHVWQGALTYMRAHQTQKRRHQDDRRRSRAKRAH